MSLSRRGFIFGIAAAGAGVAASGLLGGCSPSENGVNEAANGGIPSGSGRYVDVVDVDVVIVGSGVAGLTAAKAAMESRQSVLMLDKGPFGHSGASGINWGHGLSTVEYASDEVIESVALPTFVMMFEGMCDQEYTLALLKGMKEAKMCDFAEKTGSMPERALDGTSSLVKDEGSAFGTMMGFMPRLVSQALVRRGLQVLDRTMVIDVALTEDGKAGGVIALDLKNGNPRLIRSKAVVFAMGNYMWANGWGTCAAQTNTGPEDTGDAYAIMLRHGVRVTGMENAYFTAFQVYPTGAMGANSAYCASGGREYGDENGNRKAGDYIDLDTATTYGMQIKRLQARIKRDIGALYTYPNDIPDGDLPLYTRRAKEDMLVHYGYELPDALEIDFVPCSTSSKPLVDTSGETSLENLFWAGGGEFGWLGNLGTGSVASGHVAGKGAVARAVDGRRPTIDWDYAADVLAKCYESLESKNSDGIRPVTIMHSIQAVMYDSWGQLVCDEVNIKAGIEELNRIKDQDIPKMAVASKSTAFNVEWRQALEVGHMWDCVMATLQASLARTETRGCHIRTDYPIVDNENWLKDVIVSKQNGVFSTDTRDVIDSYVPIETIREMLAADLSMFEQE